MNAVMQLCTNDLDCFPLRLCWTFSTSQFSFQALNAVGNTSITVYLEAWTTLMRDHSHTVLSNKEMAEAKL